jgi:AbrB family looped-hinge helix DNA binding protein
MTTSVTQKGQITIPAPFRRQLGLKTGSKCRFMIRGDELILIPMRKEMGIADMQTIFKASLGGSESFIDKKASEKSLEL